MQLNESYEGEQLGIDALNELFHRYLTGLILAMVVELGEDRAAGVMKGLFRRQQGERFLPGLNYYLPEDIAVREASVAPADFDPRRHAIARVYRYALLESDARSPLRGRFAHHVGHTLDVAAMQTALEGLQGERDFAPYCGNLPDGGSTVRFMYRTQVWRQDVDEVLLELEANAYLHQQVRRITAAALQVGLGKTTLDEFTAVADSKFHGAAALVLPAKGLTLCRVEYQDFSPLTGLTGAAQQQNTEQAEVPVG